MSHLKLHALVAIAIGLSLPGLAHAQPGANTLVPPALWTKPDYDLIDKADRIDERARIDLIALHKKGIEALQARNFAAAEKTLTELVGRSPTATDANFLMGLAKIGLGKWDEAKGYLEVAVLKEPKRPEPKTRLGLAYVRVNNLDGAKKLRAELASLDTDCKRTCEDATWIADGLVLLDQALAQPTTALAAAATPAGLSAALKDFDPAAYSLTTFDDDHDLYDLLTKDGRCPPKKLAEARQPCALILYQPINSGEGLTANFKPVFSVVSRTTIWAIHNKKLQKVRIENLYFDDEAIIGQKKMTYRSVALIGNAENKANCEKGLPCLGSLVVQDMFRMYGNMPDSVVAVIWGEGMKDPGTIRVR